MDAQNIRTLLEDLEVNIDELEAALEPLLTKPLAQSANNLPLLDRAKLYATTVYSIESLIFNSLKIAGIDPSTHPVKTELNRVKQYFTKIKDAENPSRPTLVLDKQAAGRFIKAALSGNERYDREREEAIRRNKEAAQKKLAEMDSKKRKLDHDGEVKEKSKRQKAEDTTTSAIEVDDPSTPNSNAGQPPSERRATDGKFFSPYKKKLDKPPRTAKEVAEALKRGSLGNSTKTSQTTKEATSSSKNDPAGKKEKQLSRKAHKLAKKAAKKKAKEAVAH